MGKKKKKKKKDFRSTIAVRQVYFLGKFFFLLRVSVVYI